MKRIVLITLAMASLMAYAQHQLPNPGFEQWDGGNTSEPTHWNSFATSDGDYATLASSPHHYRRIGGRPGTQGSHYVTIYTKSIMGIKANGNMTTGRIHAGSMSASSSENYNYTQRSNANHCQPFRGTPDSMYVWVSYYASSANSQAQVTAILHGDNDFRAPNQENDASLYCGKAEARFTRTTTSAHSYQWQLMKVPFVYSGNTDARYMLVNMTTNATPGGGDGNDSLSIDDIMFVYSSWLIGISVNGVPIAGFDKGVMDYVLHVDDLEHIEIEAQPEVDDADIFITQETVDDSTVLYRIRVTAEDGFTYHYYTVTLSTSQSVGIPHSDLQLPTSALNIYPNPTLDAVTVEAEGPVTLLSLDGRTFWQRDVHGTARFDLKPLPAGTYLVRCGTAVRRIIKNR